VKSELTSILRKEYAQYNHSPFQLANIVLDKYFSGSPPEFPINIFQLLRDFGVFYEFRELNKLEGAYSPESMESPAAILINIGRPFQRQRFTCAHELAHHLKDYNTRVLCPFNSKNPIERYADNFAGELLMPTYYFKREANKLLGDDGYVDPEEAFKLCHIFGTSYTAVIWKLYKLNFLSFYPDKKFFRKAKAAQKLGEAKDVEFLSNIVNNYQYFPQEKSSPLWLHFQHELVFHDNRIEGVEIDFTEVAEVLTDLRIFGQESEYYEKFAEGERFEVIGHSYVYEYIADVNDCPDRLGILHLNKTLFSLSPVVEELGKFRTIENRITGARIPTTQPHFIEQEIYFLCKDISELYDLRDTLSISSYLLRASCIHHKFTQIHPFEEGNGRVARAILNWLLKLKGLPPVYIDYQDKDEYVSALTQADGFKYEQMHAFFLKRLLYSFIKINDEFSILLEDEYSNIV
jgi:Zn-dependent peptidase ImmA (M78 family)